MFAIWLILGLLLILSGLFNRQFLSLLGLKPMSALFTHPRLAQSTRIVERIGQALVITLGISFLIQGLDGALPYELSSIISIGFLGVMGLMIFTIIGITIAYRKTK